VTTCMSTRWMMARKINPTPLTRKNHQEKVSQRVLSGPGRGRGPTERAAGRSGMVVAMEKSPL
jgi:hypothetical protein